MMKDTITRLAGEEGWSEATQIAVLAGVIDSLVSQGIVSRERVVDLAEEWRADGDEMPSIGDDIEMDGVECEIEIAEIPQDQPRAKDGIYAIVDQYGETHQVESNGEVWTVIVE